MGLLTKKKEKEVAAPKPSGIEIELVMHNTTTLTADEDAEFCTALFQTDKPLLPEEWQMLARQARSGARFVLIVFPGEVADGKR